MSKALGRGTLGHISSRKRIVSIFDVRQTCSLKETLSTPSCFQTAAFAATLTSQLLLVATRQGGNIRAMIGRFDDMEVVLGRGAATNEINTVCARRVLDEGKFGRRWSVHWHRVEGIGW